MAIWMLVSKKKRSANLQQRNNKIQATIENIEAKINAVLVGLEGIDYPDN